MTVTKTRVLVIGAGPIGLEVHGELKRRGIACVHVDKAQIGSTVQWFPSGMTFFSSSDRIGICGVPFINSATGFASTNSLMRSNGSITTSIFGIG